MENYEDKMLWRIAERRAHSVNWSDVREMYHEVLKGHKAQKAEQRARRRVIRERLRYE